MSGVLICIHVQMIARRNFVLLINCHGACFLCVFSKLGLDLVPRVGPFSVNPSDVGIVALHNVHMSSDETAKNTSVSYDL